MEKLTIAMIISIIGLVAGLFYQHFGIIMKLKDDFAKALKDQSDDFNEAISKQNEQISDLCVKVGKIEERNDIFWESVKSRVVDSLKTFPTDVEKRDVLLDKFKENSLSLEEAQILRTILDCELMEQKTKNFGYVLVITRLEQIINDLRKEKVGTDGNRINVIT